MENCNLTEDGIASSK